MKPQMTANWCKWPQITAKKSLPFAVVGGSAFDVQRSLFHPRALRMDTPANAYEQPRTTTNNHERFHAHSHPFTPMNTVSRCLTPFNTVKKSLAPLQGHSLCLLILTRLALNVESWMLNVQCSVFIPTSRPFRPNPTQSGLPTHFFMHHGR
jgi:hypothetical protein